VRTQFIRALTPDFLMLSLGLGRLLSFLLSYSDYFWWRHGNSFASDTIPFNEICREGILLLDNEIAFNEAIIEEREQGVREIQGQVGEVNEIFKDLAVLIHDQGVVIGKFPNPSEIQSFLVGYSLFTLTEEFSISHEYNISLFQIDDVHSNIDASATATSQAKVQLSRASKSVKSRSSWVIVNPRKNRHLNRSFYGLCYKFSMLLKYMLRLDKRDEHTI